jgi:hypothetical protein
MKFTWKKWILFFLIILFIFCIFTNVSFSEPYNNAVTSYDSTISGSEIPNKSISFSDLNRPYHSTPTEEEIGKLTQNQLIRNQYGQLIPLPAMKSIIQTNINYHPPGSAVYGYANYVPSYEDAIYLTSSNR